MYCGMIETTENEEKTAETLVTQTIGDKTLNLDPSEYRLQFSAAGILEALGGAVKIREELARYDLPEVSRSVINMWRYRNSIPADWLATMIVVADRMGIDFDLKQHVIAVVRKPLRERLTERIATKSSPVFK